MSAKMIYPRKRKFLRFDISEITHKRVEKAAEESNISVKDWVYKIILAELDRKDIKQILE